MLPASTPRSALCLLSQSQTHHSGCTNAQTSPVLGLESTPTNSRLATPATASRAGNQGPLRVVSTTVWHFLSAASVALAAFDNPSSRAPNMASMTGTRITERLQMKAALEAGVVLSDFD